MENLVKHEELMYTTIELWFCCILYNITDGHLLTLFNVVRHPTLPPTLIWKGFQFNLFRLVNIVILNGHNTQHHYRLMNVRSSAYFPIKCVIVSGVMDTKYNWVFGQVTRFAMFCLWFYVSFGPRLSRLFSWLSNLVENARDYI